MRIVFADFCGWDFHAGSVDAEPMGGSQSAACHLARALVCEGHDVFLISNTSAPGVHEGVRCVSWLGNDAAALVRSLRPDAFVCILAAGNGVNLRRILGPGPLLVLWNQHAHDQPGVQPLADARERAAYDGFAMVSDWQLGQYNLRFGINRWRMAVMRNAIAPAFADLFPAHESILARKAAPPMLAYTSTPFRGLDLLLDAFFHIRQAIPDIRLRVFSSMKVYHTPASQDEAVHGALYRRCRETDGIAYAGSLPQPLLARELAAASVLAYPNTFPETSCISVMEAMAAGCRVVTSDLGALPETCGGFARLIPCVPSRADYLRQFTEQTVAAVREMTGGGTAERELRRQVMHLNASAVWPLRAKQWTQWLATLATQRRA